MKMDTAQTLSLAAMRDAALKPPEQRERAERAIVLNGPIVDPEGRSDVLAKQVQVDDLLASLGF